MQSGRQFEYEVVLNSELDSNSAIIYTNTQKSKISKLFIHVHSMLSSLYKISHMYFLLRIIFRI
jgi:hypothetical protein